MRTTRAVSVLAVASAFALSLAGTAHAQSSRQTTAPRAPQLLPTQMISAPAPDDGSFQLDDALRALLADRDGDGAPR